jgi:ribonuclease G
VPGHLLVINADSPETRVALIENGQLAELYLERQKERGIVGNIYKGRVKRVLPGMQAAFVDIGAEKASYLYVGDIRGAPEDFKALFTDSGDEEGGPKKRHQNSHAKIEDLVKEGQTLLLQIAKGPIGTKGARATSYISMPGRNLVYMPTVDHVGISRRITSDKERKRLRTIVDSMRPEGAGFIVRTVAENVSERELRADMDFLIKLWNSIVKKNETAKAPSLLYGDLDLVLRSVRDLFTADVEKLIIDSKSEYERLTKFVKAFMPDFGGKIELYEGRDPIFDGYGLEREIDRALQRKVFLKSGGSLIVDEGEALTAIDVNTGKFVGKKSLEDTITITNLEAAKEVAEQLRLRNIGGMIIVDFIDMDRQQHREKVMRAFEEALKNDKSKANITKISELGLVEMTRKRTRESLSRTLTEPCPYCEGRGFVKSKITVAYEILRRLRRDGGTFQKPYLVVSAHPEVVALLKSSEGPYLDELEKRQQKRIMFVAERGYHMQQFELTDRNDAPPNAQGAPTGEGGARKRRRRGGRGRNRGEGQPVVAGEENVGDETENESAELSETENVDESEVESIEENENDDVAKAAEDSEESLIGFEDDDDRPVGDRFES